MRVCFKTFAFTIGLFILTIYYCFLTYRKVDVPKPVGESVYSVITTAKKPSRPSISLFVRMPGKLKEHQTRFYCDFFRTAALFWPPSFGKTVIVLDEESKLDHTFGEQVTRQVRFNRFNTTNFEEAFKKFYNGNSGYISPVSVVISYAWFFEKDRYDWNIKICSDLKSYNGRFSSEHRIRPEHIENILSKPRTAFHLQKTNWFLFSNVLTSYCLSHTRQQKMNQECVLI